jgi:hypothetical protein
MRTKELLLQELSIDFPKVNVIDLVNDNSLFSGVISGSDVKEFGAGMYRRRIVKIAFVWDIEESKYFFTELK